MSNTKMKTVTLSFPQRIEVEDYHEFNYIKDMLKAFGVKGVYFTECTEEDDHRPSAIFKIRG